MSTHLRLVAKTDKPLVSGRHPNFVRKPNAALRTREYLTQNEVTALMAACKRTGLLATRDSTMILMAFRHGLRAAEVVDLRWNQVDFAAANLHVRRIKGSTPSVHPIMGDELRALRKLKDRQHPDSAFVFVSANGAPLAPASFARMVARTGEVAGLGIKVHAHMLRHACGFALANKGTDTRTLQAYLGHASITNTVGYTELAPNRFADFWR